VVARTYKLIPERKALSNKFSLILVAFLPVPTFFYRRLFSSNYGRLRQAQKG
jgi:hypothetical protein